MDAQKWRISLGMKSIESESHIEEKETGSSNEHDVIPHQNGHITSVDNIYEKLSNNFYPTLEKVESKISVPPLDVALDDEIDISDVDNGHIGNLETSSEQTLITKKTNRQLKRREKEERYEYFGHFYLG